MDACLTGSLPPSLTRCRLDFGARPISLLAAAYIFASVRLVTLARRTPYAPSSGMAEKSATVIARFGTRRPSDGGRRTGSRPTLISPRASVHASSRVLCALSGSPATRTSGISSHPHDDGLVLGGAAYRTWVTPGADRPHRLRELFSNMVVLVGLGAAWVCGVVAMLLLGGDIDDPNSPTSGAKMLRSGFAAASVILLSGSVFIVVRKVVARRRTA